MSIERYSRLGSILLIASSLVACSSDEPAGRSGGDDVSQSIGPEGGEVVVGGQAVDGGASPAAARLGIPAGALDKSTKITMRRGSDEPSVSGLVPGSVWVLEPAGLAFKKAARLELAFSEGDLPADVQPSSLRLARLEGGRWVRVESSEPDQARGVVTGLVDALGTWAIVGEVQTLTFPDAGATGDGSAAGSDTTYSNCSDNRRNGDESDVDCGGSCAPCADGLACRAPEHCESGVCEASVCVAPSCGDAVQNGDESDVDCGGSCGKCDAGKRCASEASCASGVCEASRCVASSCDDGVKNGDETDVDCGKGCDKCPNGKACEAAADCTSNVCDAKTCVLASCTDKVKNGDETDVDCGGTCAPCAAGKSCAGLKDCASGICENSRCSAPACDDGVKNGDETDVDCGGRCSGCSDTLRCAKSEDCSSRVCRDDRCAAAACNDRTKNGTETDVDCGGSCQGCAPGKACGAPKDCASAVCTGLVCAAPTCSDGAKNGGESDVDCGGDCADCGNGKGCETPGDCTSAVCAQNKCQAPTCNDKVKNGSETDVDCGGSCAKCGDNKKCGTNTDCASGRCDGKVCASSCIVRLNVPLGDSWGETWDTRERGQKSFEAARDECAALGGRLPTATELHRVNAASGAGGVGQSTDTNDLWALNPYSTTEHVAIRLSDGRVSHYADATARPFRCVCPDVNPNAFSAAACHHNPGDKSTPACFGLQGEGKRYNMDSVDRAPVSAAAAVWECAFVNAHLAGLRGYAEAIMAGLPNGSNRWLHTADQAHYEQNARVLWSGTRTDWFPDTSSTVTHRSLREDAPFRCAGANYLAGRFPAVAGEFVPPKSRYKCQIADDAAAPWTAAHDACWSRGGHLAGAVELTELIQEGLPNGTGQWLWTSDQTGWDGAGFTTSILKWDGVAPGFGYYYSDHASWAYKHADPRPFRCVYYPIDAAYKGPRAADCAGGCKSQLVGGTGKPAKVWFDTVNRAPANFGSAINTCRQAGGHLASERDLLEGIRHGLPNGTNEWIWTADAGNGPNVNVVRWFNQDPAFSDFYDSAMTHSGLTDLRPYRCVWTNELR